MVETPFEYSGFSAWGEPGTPLLPRLLRECWQLERVPQWVVAALNLPEKATFVELGPESLSDSIQFTDRLQRWLAYEFSIRRSKIKKFPAFPFNWPERLSPRLVPWRMRTMNCLVSAGLIDRPQEFAGLAFADLLRIRHMGILSILDATATAEAAAELLRQRAESTEAPQEGGGKSRFKISLSRQENEQAHEKRKARPPLPEALLDVWGPAKLPRQIAAALELQPGATGEDLWKSGIWPNALLRKDLINWTSSMLRTKIRKIADRKISNGVFASQIDPRSLPWSKRTRNIFERAGLLNDPKTLWETTMGDLASLENMGFVSVIGILNVLEGFLPGDSGTPAIGFSQPFEELRKDELDEFHALMDKAWVSQVSPLDLRFHDVLPFRGKETVLNRINSTLIEDDQENRALRIRSLLAAVPQIEQRMRSIEALSLESSLRDYLTLLCEGDAKQAEAMGVRFGWTGSEQRTLEQAGKVLNVTRERIRQIEKKVRPRIPAHPVFMPALDRALDFLAESCPLSLADAGEALCRSGLADRPWEARSILQAASDLHRNLQLEERSVADDVLLVQAHRPESNRVNEFLSLAKRQAGASGVSSIREVVAEAERSSAAADPEFVRRILRPHVRFLIGDWFWAPGLRPERNRLRNVIRKMLSLGRPIEIDQILNGVRRHYKNRQSRGRRTWRITSPEKTLLSAFVAAHPEFEFDGERVSSLEKLDYRAELSGNEKIVVQTLLDRQDNIARRNELYRECKANGMSGDAAFSALLGGSPMLQNLATGIWGLCGYRYDPEVIGSIEDATQPRRNRRTVSFVSHTESSLTIEAVLPEELGALVIGIPASIRDCVSGQRFSAEFKDGLLCGSVCVAENGASWGYNQFIRHAGAGSGDRMRIRFDFGKQRVVLDMVEGSN